MTEKYLFYYKKFLKKYLNKIGIHFWDYALMVPRMYFSEYIFFKHFLKAHPKALYLESGSGGSTILVDQLPLTYFSYETDLAYVQYMNGLLKKGRLHHLDVGAVLKFGFPKEETAAHAKKINSALLAHFPLTIFPYTIIFIDGRCRVSTALALVPYLSLDDFVMIHDFERPHYKDVLEVYDMVQSINRLVLLKRKKEITPRLEALQKKYALDFR